MCKGLRHWEFPQWLSPQGDVFSVCVREECGPSVGANVRTDGGRELKTRQMGQERWKGLNKGQQSFPEGYQVPPFRFHPETKKHISPLVFAQLNIPQLSSHFNVGLHNKPFKSSWAFYFTRSIARPPPQRIRLPQPMTKLFKLAWLSWTLAMTECKLRWGKTSAGGRSVKCTAWKTKTHVSEDLPRVLTQMQ